MYVPLVVAFFFAADFFLIGGTTLGTLVDFICIPKVLPERLKLLF